LATLAGRGKKKRKAGKRSKTVITADKECNSIGVATFFRNGPIISERERPRAEKKMERGVVGDFQIQNQGVGGI